MAKFIKSLMAEELKRELDDSPQVLVVGLGPMDAETNLGLRNELRDLGARLRVIHNRTSRFALDEARRPLAEFFRGPTALTLVGGEEPDMVAVAKALVEAARKKRVEVRGGYVDDEVLDKAGVEFLSRSPDKNTLRGMLAGTIVAPGRGLAVCINAVCAGIARCLSARIEQSGEEPQE